MKTIAINTSCGRSGRALAGNFHVMPFLTYTTFLAVAKLLLIAVLTKQMIGDARRTKGSDLSFLRAIDNIEKGYNLPDVCRSDECNRTAQEVLNKMKEGVEPCENFYQFACGNYVEKTEIPEDKVAVGIFVVIREKLQMQLGDILEATQEDSSPRYLKLANSFYKACMNSPSIEALGTKHVQKVSNSLGGWPVIVGSSWNSDNSWTWQSLIKKLRRIGFSTDTLLTFSVKEDLKNNARHILDLDQTSLGLHREYLVQGLSDSTVMAYYNYMVDIAVLFGAEKETAEKELRECLKFEIDLATISLPNEKRRNSISMYNPRSIRQMQESYPYVDWLDFLNALLPEGVKINENEVINLAVPNYFEDLGKLLERTNNRIIANYIMWRVHMFSVGFLTEEFRNRQLQYDRILFGRQQYQDRWKECSDVVSNALPAAVGSLYVRKHFKGNSKVSALEMVENLRSAFSEMIDSVKWMDNETKQHSKRKLQAMTAHIGYPDELLDNKKMEEYYHGLSIDPDNYFQSLLNIKLFYTDHSLGKLRLPVNKTDWTQHSHITVVNAFYSMQKNSIQFPAGILQGDFFNNQRPNYMNYGASGLIIGHEITHGFDDQGHQFDKDGNLVDWWQPDTKNAYLENSKCIIEQYGNYTEQITGLKLNGVHTVGENIADNGGLKEAYLAYKKWVAENGEERKLPGLNYTPQQMFWISAAQTFCAKFKPEIIKLMITTDPHTPDEFRALGALRNMKDFSRDFQCPDNSPMNPVKKCEVW